jgi:NAD(P)-dependent dehydrogenase (short-subunit alcohol dehydrogenase family)
VPLGRIARPGEVANAALFPLSAGASCIIGTELIADGSLLMGY